MCVLILSSIVEDRDSIVTKENTRCEHFSKNNDDNASHYNTTHSKSQ